MSDPELLTFMKQMECEDIQSRMKPRKMEWQRRSTVTS
jgi:hypothetical protein